MTKRPLQDAQEVTITSRAELHDWLTAHHGQESGVWLVTYKKAVPEKYVGMSDITPECLAFGWVDSLSRGKDAERTMVYIAPRKEGSNWSALNKRYVAELEAAGLMTPAGAAKIARAKADGTWTALDDVENLVVPPDLQAAFDRYPGAEAYWHDFPRSPKRAILEWILNAKRPETRAKRIEETARLAAENTRANQWR